MVKTRPSASASLSARPSPMSSRPACAAGHSDQRLERVDGRQCAPAGCEIQDAIPGRTQGGPGPPAGGGGDEQQPSLIRRIRRETGVCPPAFLRFSSSRVLFVVPASRHQPESEMCRCDPGFPPACSPANHLPFLRCCFFGSPGTAGVFFGLLTTLKRLLRQFREPSSLSHDSASSRSAVGTICFAINLYKT